MQPRWSGPASACTWAAHDTSAHWDKDGDPKSGSSLQGIRRGQGAREGPRTGLGGAPRALQKVFEAGQSPRAVPVCSPESSPKESVQTGRRWRPHPSSRQQVRWPPPCPPAAAHCSSSLSNAQHQRKEQMTLHTCGLRGREGSLSPRKAGTARKGCALERAPAGRARSRPGGARTGRCEFLIFTGLVGLSHRPSRRSGGAVPRGRPGLAGRRSRSPGPAPRSGPEPSRPRPAARPSPRAAACCGRRGGNEAGRPGLRRLEGALGATPGWHLRAPQREAGSGAPPTPAYLVGDGLGLGRCGLRGGGRPAHHAGGGRKRSGGQSCSCGQRSGGQSSTHGPGIRSA